jgi:hypothetical protein
VLLLLSTKLPLIAGAIRHEVKLDPTILQTHSKSRRRLASPITDEELDLCVTSLEEVAIDGKVGREDYLLFLEDFSSSSLTFEAFADLPVPLILVFYTAACSSGRDCINQEPAVSLDHVGASPGLLSVLCSSIKDMAVRQIEFPFQYQMQYQGNGVEAEDFLLGGIDGIDARNLEEATQLALLENLSCGTNDPHVRELQGASNSNLLLVEDAVGDAMQGIFSAPREAQQFRFSPEEREQRRRIQENANGVSQCDYIVQAQVLNIFEFGKCIMIIVPVCFAASDSSRFPYFLRFIGCLTSGARVEHGLHCALVSSKVIVTAASLTFQSTPEELRAEIASTLRHAFTNNQILDYLDL